MSVEFNEDLIAELAALNTAVIKAIAGMAALVEQSGVATRKDYLERLLVSGEEGISKTNYWSIPQEQREAVIEKAKARYMDIINAVHQMKP